LGGDGHIASIFPGSVFPDDLAAAAVTAQYADRPSQRVTLLPAVFNDARLILLLAAGAAKREALAAALSDEIDPVARPSQRLRLTKGRLIWLVDEVAATIVS
jgi:6-phosphogluconolactonase/glucosamine-6-phosphate isomerase/deaminase